MKKNTGCLTKTSKLFAQLFVVVIAFSFIGCSSFDYPYMWDIRKSVKPSKMFKYSQNEQAIEAGKYRSTSVSKGRKNLIVFVHGALGEGTTTWGNLNKGNFWPILMEKDDDFRDFDIVVYGFDTSLLSYSSDITELATQLNNTFENYRVFDRYEQIHFITHSMGGLIVKRMLTNLHFRNEKKHLKKVRTVFFNGTPASGTWLAHVGSWFSPNPQMGNLSPADINTYLRTLEQDWQDLLNTRKPLRPFPRIYCSHETKATVYSFFVVSRISAKTLCDEHSNPIDADHIDIVKPKSQAVEPYPWTKRLIKKAADLPALYNDRVVIMDTSHPQTVYSENDKLYGATNADSIDLLLKLNRIPVETIKELVNYNWKRDLAVKEFDPALIIIHLSSFFRNEIMGELPEDYNNDVLHNKFGSFIKNMEDSDTKFLIYTRVEKTMKCKIDSRKYDDVEKYEEALINYYKGVQERKKVWIEAEKMFKENQKFPEERYKLFSVPPPLGNLNGGCATFEDPSTQREFVRLVKQLLALE